METRNATLLSCIRNRRYTTVSKHCGLQFDTFLHKYQFMKTSSPKGNDRSPESNVPMSNLIFKKMDPINSNPGKVEASIFFDNEGWLTP